MPSEPPVLDRSFLREVTAALEPLRAKQRELRAVWAAQLERLEWQAAELDRRQKEAAELRAALGQERSALDQEWAHFDELVETARGHAVEVQQEKQRLELLLRQQGESEHQAELKKLFEAVDQATREKEVVEAELAALKQKLGESADLSIELAEAQSELLRLRSNPAVQDSNIPADWQSKLAEVERQRDRLAAELLEARQRGDDLLHELERERRRFAEERTEWLGELRSLRMSWGVGPTDGATPSGTPPPTPEASTPRARPDLPIDAVLNRMDAVKRDLVRHRVPRN
jgi:hypothetical protein